MPEANLSIANILVITKTESDWTELSDKCVSADYHVQFNHQIPNHTASFDIIVIDRDTSLGPDKFANGLHCIFVGTYRDQITPGSIQSVNEDIPREHIFDILQAPLELARLRSFYNSYAGEGSCDLSFNIEPPHSFLLIKPQSGDKARLDIAFDGDVDISVQDSVTLDDAFTIGPHEDPFSVDLFIVNDKAHLYPPHLTRTLQRPLNARQLRQKILEIHHYKKLHQKLMSEFTQFREKINKGFFSKPKTDNLETALNNWMEVSRDKGHHLGCLLITWEQGDASIEGFTEQVFDIFMKVCPNDATIIRRGDNEALIILPRSPAKPTHDTFVRLQGVLNHTGFGQKKAQSPSHVSFHGGYTNQVPGDNVKTLLQRLCHIQETLG